MQDIGLFNLKKYFFIVIRCTLKKLITAGKYLGRARKTGKVGMKEIAEEIQSHCPATCGASIWIVK